MRRAASRRSFAAFGLLFMATFIIACSPGRNGCEHERACPAVDQSQPLILNAADGERRLHRPPPGSLSDLTAPFILKVDRKNGGAPEFVMLTEDIPSGQGISPHMHPHSDEILFIHAGTGLATLAGRQAVVGAGATIYMPRNTVASLKNTGPGPLSIVAVFSKPGYEEYLRAISVPEGETPTPLTVDELSAIRARQLDHAVYSHP
ncbi:MAG: cupin domain-containing protein [Gemmatimonadaceae bacterium]